MKKLLKEPLVHFAMVGALLFVIFNGVNPESDADIVYDQYDYNRARTLFEQRWGREPNAEEIRSMVDEAVDKELMYRLAMEQGLHLEDQAVRDVMAARWKELFILGLRPPKEAELQAFYLGHIDDYQTPESFDVEMVSDTLGYEDSGSDVFRATRLGLYEMRNLLPIDLLSEIDEWKEGKWYGPFSKDGEEKRSFVRVYKNEVQAREYDLVEQYVREDWEKYHAEKMLDSVLIDYRTGIDVQLEFSDVDSLTL